jgi:hypothetical protein
MAEVLQFPFASGIDEGSDPKALAPGTPLVMTNRYLDKKGRCQKRWGVQALTTAKVGGGNLSAGARLVTRGSDIGVFDGSDLFAYVSTSTAWKRVDRPPNMRATWDTLVDATGGVQAVDSDVYGGNLFVAYRKGGKIYAMVVELATKAKVMPPTLLATDGAHPHVIVDTTQGVCHVFYSTAAGLVRAIRVNLATLAVSAAVSVSVSAAASTAFDVVLSGTTLYFAFQLLSGANRLRVLSTDATAAYTLIHATDFNGGIATYNSFGIAVVGLHVVVIWSETTTPTTSIASFLASTLGAVSAAGSLVLYDSFAVTVAAQSSTVAYFGYSKDTANVNDATDPVIFGTYEPATGFVNTGVAAVTANHAILSSKLFTSGGRWYAAVQTFVHPSSLTSSDAFPPWTHAIVEIEFGASATVPRHVATINPSTAWPTFTSLPRVPSDSNGVFYVPLPYAIDPPLTGWATTAPLLGFVLASLKPNTGDLWRSVIAGPAPFCAAGAPFWCDGYTTAPAGYLHQPQILAAVSDTASGSMLLGTYLYAVVYVYKDADGRLHRSPPSVAKSSILGATGKVTLSLMTSCLSGRQSALTGYAGNEAIAERIELYRSIANGPDLYLHPAVITNDPLAHSVTYVDTFADANIFALTPNISLSSRPQLYTHGGTVLDDVAPPSFLTCALQKERIWGLSGDGHTLWASKPLNEDPLVAPGFNEALTTYFSKKKSALGTLDETIVVLGRDSIDLVIGNGPDTTGGGRWDVVAMQTDRGCIEPRSIASIPPGLVFQSPLGIELLDRGKSVTWLGEAVQDTLALYPTITSAVVVSDQHQVRLSCNNAALTGGRVLVFDYLRGAWSVFDYGFAIADALLIDGIYTILRTNGTVYQETTTTHLDDGVYVAGAVEVPISPSGSNAWGRVKDVQLLGTSASNHDLTIRSRRDFAAAFEQSKTFVAQGDVTTVGPLEKARMTLARQKGQGFSFRIEDSAPTTGALGSGAGPILEGLALFVQRKQGLPKVSASRKG